MNEGPFILDRTLRLPGSPADVFPFFSDAGNLEAITPPWLHFRIVTPQPIKMCEGALIDYRLRLRGIPIKWRTRICLWNPPYEFIDEQISGPYKKWVHLHTFEADGNETICKDHIDYHPIGGRLVDKFFVKPDLKKVFDYRQEQLRKLLMPETIGS